MGTVSLSRIGQTAVFAGHETDPAAAQHTFTEARKQGEHALARLHARLGQAETAAKDVKDVKDTKDTKDVKDAGVYEAGPAAEGPTVHEPDAIQCVYLTIYLLHASLV